MSKGSIRSAERRELLALTALLGITAAHAQTTRIPLQGNPTHGEELYQGCTACHSIDENDIGPKHRGVVGRKAGTVPDYAYSSALKASGIVWDAANLNRWLMNPSAMVPGTKMYFLLPDPQDRADIIAYLAELK
jgi:cytochrome c